MKLGALSHAFNSFYCAAFGVETKHQAGKDRATVDEHGAGAALTQLTTMLRAGEIQIFTQNFEQCFVRCEGDLDVFTVEPERDVFLSVALHRLSSSPCSKSYYQSVAFYRRRPRLR